NGVVDEVEDAAARPLDRDRETDPIGAPTWERSARVLAADRVHEAAALVGALLDDAAPQGGHPVGVGEVGDREADARVAAHVLCLPRPVGGADEDQVPLDPNPNDVVARRTIRPQRGEMHIVGRVQELTYLIRDRDREGGSSLHTRIDPQLSLSVTPRARSAERLPRDPVA